MPLPSTRLCTVKLSKMCEASLLELADKKFTVKSSAASGIWRWFSKGLRKKVSALLRNEDARSIPRFPRSWQMRLPLPNWENRTGASSPASYPKATGLLCLHSCPLCSPVRRAQEVLPCEDLLILRNLPRDITSAVCLPPCILCLFFFSGWFHHHIDVLRSPCSRNKWQEQLSSSKPTEPSIPDSLLPASQQNFLKWVSIHCLHALAPSPLQPLFHFTLHRLLLLGSLTGCVLPFPRVMYLPSCYPNSQELSKGWPRPHSSSISSLGSATPHFPRSLSGSASFFFLSYAPLPWSNF